MQLLNIFEKKHALQKYRQFLKHYLILYSLTTTCNRINSTKLQPKQEIFFPTNICCTEFA